MLVAYSVSTLSTYSGVIALTTEEYEQLNKMTEIDQGTRIMTRINWGENEEPEFRSVECVSHFAPV